MTEEQISTNQAIAATEVRPELNSLRLQFGDTMQLQVAGEDERFPVRLIGYLEKRSIIVTAPIKNRRLLSIRSGQSINVRMMLNDNACAFSTSILHLYRLPYPHMHIEYPVEFETNNVRKATRVKVKVSAKVINTSIGDRGKELDCFLADISEGGAHLVTPIRIGKTGDEISLSINLKIAGISRILGVTAVIRNRIKAKSESDQREVHYGIEFLSMSDEERIGLIAFIYSKLSSGG